MGAAGKVQPINRRSVSEEEWALRVDLAAAYRLCALYGWDDQISTHISARLPGREHHFLINPFGLLFEEITASSLVKIDLDGKPLEPTPYRINRAGFVIHSAVHRAREDAQCVLHLHTIAGTAVSAQREGLLPISIRAMHVYGRIGYHDFEGITVDDEEQPRIVAALGDNLALFLRNHGTITVGETIPVAFQRMYFVERACQIQVAAMSGGSDLCRPDAAIADLVRSQVKSGFADGAQFTWDALLRKLDRIDPSYGD